ncbi:hypothetical protein [Microbacterium paludicola]|uniref:hypothetical protein n=1 Tax=Microbacterium paludicola TaxID=300019 RepID=UPI0031D2D3A5
MGLNRPSYDDGTFEERGDYTPATGRNYLTPNGLPRALGVGERAQLMRSHGMRRSQVLPDDGQPAEYGIKLRD